MGGRNPPLEQLSIFQVLFNPLYIIVTDLIHPFYNMMEMIAL